MILAEFNPFEWVIVAGCWVLVLWGFMAVLIWTISRWPRRRHWASHDARRASKIFDEMRKP